MTAQALGLNERDFDAYSPERATSNAYSRPRLEFKQRALAWVRRLIGRLAQLGISVDVQASDEHPSVWNNHRVDCQWLFLWCQHPSRAELDALIDQQRGIAQVVQDPTPYFRHAFFALRLASEKLEVCVQLHPDAWVDFDTLRARLGIEERAAAIVDAIRDLPEQFEVGLVSQPAVACATVSGETLRGLLAGAADSRLAFWVGWSIDRQTAVKHSELLDEQLEDALVALAPVYQQLRWTADDDPAGVGAKLESMRERTARRAAERSAEAQRTRDESDRQRREANERSRERTREKIDLSSPRQKTTLANLFKEPSTPTPGSSRTPLGHQHRHEARAADLPVTPAASTHSAHRDHRHTPNARPPKAATAAAIDSNQVPDRGSRVEVLQGPFSGKIGVVSDLDGRGGARVMLGLLSTRLPVVDLAVVVEPRDRPALHSSHRNPTPGRRGGK